MATSAFFGFFRLGELLHESIKAFAPTTGLSWGDVALDSLQAPRMMQIHLKVSKCDQFSGGANIVLGVTDDALCPVKAMVLFVKRGCALGPFFHKASGETAVCGGSLGDLGQMHP